MKNGFVIGLALLMAGCMSYDEEVASESESMDDDVVTSLDDDSMGGIGSVSGVYRLSAMECQSEEAGELLRDASEVEVMDSGVVTLPEMGVHFLVPTGDGAATSVKLLDDQSRGLQDYYVLLGSDEVSAPFGAMVVTDMGERTMSAEQMWKAVEQMQTTSAGKDISDSKMTMETMFGPTLEYIVEGRQSEGCFPTGAYEYGMSDQVTISRFVMVDNNLVEFSLVVDVMESDSAAMKADTARMAMESFWSGFSTY